MTHSYDTQPEILTADQTRGAEWLRDNPIYDGNFALHQEMRAAVDQLYNPSTDGMTVQEQARLGIDQQHRLSEILTTTEVAQDPAKIIALFAETAGLPVCPGLSGHYTLTTAAIQRLGNGSEYQANLLKRLDKDSIGVFMATTLLDGSSAPYTRSTVHMDSKTKTMTLNTDPRSPYFAPNVAAEGVPYVTITMAQLYVDGEHQGAYPFVFQMQDKDGVHEGVTIARLPDVPYSAMAHGMIKCENVEFPTDALLGGDVAWFDEDGVFHRNPEVPARRSFHKTTETLLTGRAALTTAILAGARKNLVDVMTYVGNRKTAKGIPMGERDNVQRDLASLTAGLYAVSALGNVARDIIANPNAETEEKAHIAAALKPLSGDTLLEGLQTMRERIGFQGMLPENGITKIQGHAQGCITAEGDNRMLDISSGFASIKAVSRGKELFSLVEPDAKSPWWHDALKAREEYLIKGAVELDRPPTGEGDIGTGTYLTAIAGATTDRLLVESLLAHADKAPNDMLRGIVRTMAKVVALERIDRRFRGHRLVGKITAEQEASMDAELREGYNEIWKNMPMLMRAFATPPSDAPIAAEDYSKAWREKAGWA